MTAKRAYYFRWLKYYSLSFLVAATAPSMGDDKKPVQYFAHEVREDEHNVISVRFSGGLVKTPDGKTARNEAIPQAIEVGPGHGGEGAEPVELSEAELGR